MQEISVRAERQSPKRTAVQTAEGSFEIGREGSPLEYLLGSLAGCINVIGTLVADDMGIEIESLAIEVAGDIDERRYKGESEEPPAGFQELRVEIDIEADAEEATLLEWMGRVQDRCPVAENLRDGTDLSVDVRTR